MEGNSIEFADMILSGLVVGIFKFGDLGEVLEGNVGFFKLDGSGIGIVDVGFFKLGGLGILELDLLGGLREGLGGEWVGI